MSVKCPICETENPDETLECVQCGKILATEADLLEDIPPIAGLEQTIHDPMESATGPIAAIPELEQTMVARRDLQVAADVLPGVERTKVEEDPEAPIHWIGGVDLDLGREKDDGVRTPAPQDTGLCPWCNAPATGAVCDNCGRRKSRYSAPPVQQQHATAAGEAVLCPACFARVAPGPRCVECGVPFPLPEVA
jgi:hypothetical protein